MGAVWVVDSVAHHSLPPSSILMKELRPGWVWEMGVLNIADQVRYNKALRVRTVAQSICWEGPALVRSKLRINRTYVYSVRFL